MFVATLGMDYFKMKLRPSPALEAPDHDHLLGLVYNCKTLAYDHRTLAFDCKTWAYPMSTVLATVAFLPLLYTSLLSQGGIMHYSQQLTLQCSTKLLFGHYYIHEPQIATRWTHLNTRCR